MRKALLLLAAFSICGCLMAQKPAWQPAPGHTTLPIWPNGAPGAQPNVGPEVDATTAKDNLIAGKPLIRLGNVSVPTLTLYSPKGKNTGAAVVVFPGGGYHILAIDLEGTEVCDWLNSAGITCALLKYRVPGFRPLSQVLRRPPGCAAGSRPRPLPCGRVAHRPPPHRRSGFLRWRRTSPPPSAPTSISASTIPSTPPIN